MFEGVLMDTRLWIVVGSVVGLSAVIATNLFAGIDIPSWFACALVTACAALGGFIGPLISNRQSVDPDVDVSGAF
jgi:ribose/xylose/arabinose/galactoside ABC-type transport system permease subunit